MTDQNIAGAEAQPIVEADQSAVVDAVETKAEVTEEAEQSDSPEAEGKWPKTAENALSKAKRQAMRAKADRDFYRQRVAELERQSSQPPEAKKEPPKPDQFNSYDEFVDAKVKHGVENGIKEQTEAQKRNQETQRAQQENARLVEDFDSRMQAAAKAIPDFDEVAAEVTDMLEASPHSIPPHVRRACLEMEHGELAMYQAFKDGRLEAIAQMSPFRAAAELTRLGDKAKAALDKPKAVTQAPAPMSALKGTSKSTKSLDDMSGQEILKWARS